MSIPRGCRRLIAGAFVLASFSPPFASAQEPPPTATTAEPGMTRLNPDETTSFEEIGESVDPVAASAEGVVIGEGYYGDPAECHDPQCPCHGSHWERWKARQQAKWWGYPEEFQEPPFGAFVHAPFLVQVQNAQAVRMVLYRFDFVEGSSMLNASGQRRLQRMARMLPMNDFPVIVQRTAGRTRLNAARRQEVIRQLADQPFPVAHERVRLGDPIAKGLRGTEARTIQDNFQEQTEEKGRAPGRQFRGFGFGIRTGGGSSQGGLGGGSP